MLLKKAVEKERKIYSTPGSSNVSRKLGEYSSLLASQGCVDTALGYLRQDTADQVGTPIHSYVLVVNLQLFHRMMSHRPCCIVFIMQHL